MKKTKGKVCVIDDDIEILELLENFLRREGYAVKQYSSAVKALYDLEQNPEEIDVVLSDLKMPEMSGIEFVEKAKRFMSPTPIVLMSAHGTIELAVSGIRSGAYDYVVKPLKFANLALTLERAIKYGQLERDNHFLRKEFQSQQSLEGVLGKTPAMQTVFQLVKRVAPTPSSVLITGESGTGKEVIARQIHLLSQRAKQEFVALNCSAIPGNLLESELFGHAKGSFTGATESRLGMFEEAHLGTLFLDEIGDMPLELQAKLLRVLQERKIKRVGENKYRDIDVRVISATHKDLKTEIKEGRFREDLYYRLCVIPLTLPALRERKDDIPLLADHFLKKYAALIGKKVSGFSTAAMAQMMEMNWRGNVRELQNAIERAVVLADGDVIDESQFPKNQTSSAENGLADGFSRLAEGLPTLEEFEYKYIVHVLSHTGDKKEKAAQILGIDRKTLYRKIKETPANQERRTL